MRQTRIVATLLTWILAVGMLPWTPPPVRAEVASTRESAVRVVGPNGERVPVLNEGGASLQLKVVDANGATVPGNSWRTDSPGIAMVNNRGLVTPTRDGTGFATVYAQTSQGEAKCFVAVMRVRSQTGGMVQGDTKADTAGRIYLSDPVHHVIVRSQGGQSERWIGANDQDGFHDGKGTEARFRQPSGLAVDLSAQGGLYIADSLNHCIRKASFEGRLGTERQDSVIVGEAEISGTMAGAESFPIEGFRLSGPQGVVSVGGNLYITDTENHCIWYADVAGGEVRLVAGRAGEPGLDDGLGGEARFNHPSGLAINSRGNLLAVADTGNDVVRLIRIGRDTDGRPQHRVSTVGVASSGRVADAAKVAETDDLADAVMFDAPRSVSIDGVENIYVIDERTATVVTRPEEGEPIPVALAADGTLGDAVSLTLSGTRALVLDGSATSDAEAVREVTVGAPEIERVTPEVTSLAGGETVVIEGSNFAPESLVTLGDRVVTDVVVRSARRIEFVVPAGISAPGVRTVTVATRGGLDQEALAVRARGLGEFEPGEITTVAGGVPYVGDGGPATSAQFNFPNGLAVDAAGNLYIADTNNNRIRRVDMAGRITTVAGTGVRGYNGDDKPATSARFDIPIGVAVDAAGNIYIADFGNSRIRRVDASGRITTVAGTSVSGYNGDGGPATSARLGFPKDVAVDAAGNLYIAINDFGGDAIRAVRQPGAVGGDRAPSIHAVQFATSADMLVLKEHGFGASGAIVRVNGTDVSPLIRKQSNRKLLLQGSADELGLQAGGNEITVTADGRTSADFPLFH